MSIPAQTSSRGGGDGPRRRVLRGGGALLISLLTLPASAHAAAPAQSVELPTPVQLPKIEVPLPPAPVVGDVVPQTPPATPASSQSAASAAEPPAAQAPRVQVAPAPKPAAARRVLTAPRRTQPRPPTAAIAHVAGAGPGVTGRLARSSPRRATAVSHRPPAAHPRHFTLVAVPVADRAPAEAGGPDIPLALAPGGAKGADIAITILLIAGGALLIALMCVDAAGVGPRHAHLRRGAGWWRVPWR